MLPGSLLARHSTSSGRGWRRRPPDMKSSREYFEKAAADSPQGVNLQLRGWAGI